MIWIVRLLLMIAAPITALFVARDALNFGVLQTFVATVLVTGVVALAAWRQRRGNQDS
jgi:hypothetical protein